MIERVECHLGGCPYYQPKEVCTHPKAENKYVAQRMEGDVPRLCPIAKEVAILVVEDDKVPDMEQIRRARKMLSSWEKILTGRNL